MEKDIYICCFINDTHCTSLPFAQIGDGSFLKLGEIPAQSIHGKRLTKLLPHLSMQLFISKEHGIFSKDPSCGLELLHTPSHPIIINHIPTIHEKWAMNPECKAKRPI